MELKTIPSDDRQVTISATLDELIDLHDACITTRKTKAMRRKLGTFADLLASSDKELAKVVKTAQTKAKKASPHDSNFDNGS